MQLSLLLFNYLTTLLSIAAFSLTRGVSDVSHAWDTLPPLVMLQSFDLQSAVFFKQRWHGRGKGGWSGGGGWWRKTELKDILANRKSKTCLTSPGEPHQTRRLCGRLTHVRPVCGRKGASSWDAAALASGHQIRLTGTLQLPAGRVRRHPAVRTQV